MYKVSLIASLVIAFLCPMGCRELSAGRFRRDSLRNQVALLRAEQRRDKERIEILEQKLVAREERHVPSALPEWLSDLLEDLNEEIGEMNTELKRRTHVEEMIEDIQERYEQEVAKLRELNESLKSVQEEQKKLAHQVQSYQENRQQTKTTLDMANPWEEEGSGDFNEDSLIPLVPSKKTNKEEIVSIKSLVEKSLQAFRNHQNIHLKKIENQMEEKLLAVKETLEKMQDEKQESIDQCHKIAENVRRDFHSSANQMKAISDNYSNIWKHVTKIEFNGAQFQASLDVLKQDWAADNRHLQELQVDLDHVHGKLRNQSQQLITLELIATNASLQRCQKENEVSKQEIKLHNLEMRLSHTNLRMDSWSRQSDIYRSSTKTIVNALQEMAYNNTRQVDNLKEDLTEYKTALNKFIHLLPKDCSNVKQNGLNLIQVNTNPVEVYCESIQEDKSWLIVQRRIDGTVDFFRNWTEYKLGFGNPEREFWIGNDILHHLTDGCDMMLHIDMWDLLGRYWYVEYGKFRVKSELELYTLVLEEYSGNISDSFGHHSGMGFSTHDRDNDASSAHCAVHHTGGWWYQHCHRADLNGRYPLGMTWYDEHSHDWLQLQHVEMKIAPFKS